MKNEFAFDHVEMTHAQLAQIVRQLKSCADTFDDDAHALDTRKSPAADTFWNVADMLRAIASTMYAQHQPARTDDHKRTITIAITNE